jgi:hypothetical protein
VLSLHLPGDAPGLHQAGLKASALLPEAHEHCTGITDRILFNQEKSCHYRIACALKVGDTEAVAGSSDEADQMRRQFLKVAIRQIRDGPRESFERRQPADIALLDVGNERIRVTAKIKRRDLETGAAQLKRQMAAAGGRLQHPASTGTDASNAGTTQCASMVK